MCYTRPHTAPLATGGIAAFLDEVRDVCRLRHLSLRTEERCTDVIRGFVRFHADQRPAKLGAAETRQYLTHLAAERDVATSTQNVALNALVFLYRDVLKTEPGGTFGGFERARRSARLPTVFTRAEVPAVLSHLEGTHHLMTGLLYGAGATRQRSGNGARHPCPARNA